MLTIRTNITGDAAARLAAVSARLKDRQRINAAVAVAGRETVRSHLAVNYGGRTNKLGGATTGFYMRMADAVEGKATGTGAEVTIDFAGAALHYYGGTIRPSGRTSAATGKPIQFLTIPKHPAAHGKRAADFGDRLYAVPGGLRLQLGTKHAESDPLYYIFARSANIPADKNLLPQEETIRTAVEAAIDDELQAAQTAGGAS